MIVPDVNLLLYAHDEVAAFHRPSRAWWESLCAGDVTVGIPWAVVFGFVRVSTHAAVMTEPLTPAAALDAVEDWFRHENVRILEPGPRHLAVVRELFHATRTAGTLTTDAHLAALAIEHGAELHSNDRDFTRFPGLRLFNPLPSAGR